MIKNYLTLITSVISPPKKRLNYSNIRSVFTKQERYEQTKKTIDSIRKNIPFSDIIICECSDLNEEEEEYFKENTDYFINLYTDKKIREKIYSVSKSLGEGTMMIEILKIIIKLERKYTNFFKISGRYFLNEDFNIKLFTIDDKIIFKNSINDLNNISTVLYKLPYYLLKELCIFLENKQKEMKKCIGYEIIFAKFVNQYKDKMVHYHTIGIQGFVTVNGSLFKG